ncbi:MAG: bifunctional ADP-heptose synthase [Chitinophagales bacterium]|nr:bifunctional ADP-heptose synthase [Chitinophagales bacterium]MDW8273414.1 bifunctional ADP-heptose synthase [Chitinophagales bacterium]
MKLPNFSRTHVLIIGDVMLDSYLFGEINRISPEAPVPIVEIESKEYRAGGAANVALNIKGLGGKPHLLTVTGNDDYSKEILAILRQRGLKNNYFIFSENRPTTLKTRIFDEDKQVMRFDEETTEDISKNEEEELIDTFLQIIRKESIQVIILQDYNKGVLTKRVIKQILLYATKSGIPVCVDPKEKNFFEYQNVALFKPNLKEISAALNMRINPRDVNSLTEAAEELRKKNRFRNLLLTLSQYGAYYYNESGEYALVSVKPVNAADVSGAGDTVIAAASLCFAHKMELYDITRLANHVASKVCKRVGVSPATKEDLKGFR